MTPRRRASSMRMTSRRPRVPRASPKTSPQKQKQKPAVAKKPPPASPPPAKPATTARPAAPPPPVRAAAAPDYVPDEVVFELKPDISEAEIAGVLRRFALTPLARYDLALLGTSIQHARIPRGSAVPTVVRQLAADPRVASAQPNFVFDGQADEAAAPAATQPELAGAQYAPDRMKIPEAHRLAEGKDVLVAVIDSAVDPAHPELADALIDPDAKAKPHTHGTGMAGAIAAHVKLVGIAPEARLLALDALRYDTTGAAKGTTHRHRHRARHGGQARRPRGQSQLCRPARRADGPRAARAPAARRGAGRRGRQ